MSNPHLRGVHDAAGTLIDGTTDDDGGAGGNSELYFTARESATHYVAAGAAGGSQGTYTLAVTDSTEDFTAGTNTTGTVVVGGTASGEIAVPGDRDWFAVDLEANKTYLIELKGSILSDDTLIDPYLWGVHDADGTLIDGTTNDDGGLGYNSELYFTARESGIHYVAAGAFERSQGTYTLAVTDVTDDFTAGTNTTGTVAVDSTASGEIAIPGDRDWFEVSLEAGKRYWIQIKGSDTHDGTLSDPYLRGVHDADGTLIDGTTNDDGGLGLNSELYFTASESGTHYVAAGSGGNKLGIHTLPGSEGNKLGTYTLAVTDITDDFAADTTTTGTVTVGESVTGSIEIPEDVDWFAVALEEGRTYEFHIDGPQHRYHRINPSILKGIYDASGALVGGPTYPHDGANDNSRLYFTPDADGTYYVDARVWGKYDETGPYTLSVTDVTDGYLDDYGADTDTAGAVDVGGSAEGVIQHVGRQQETYAPGLDQDWFAVTLEAGRSYRIDQEGSVTGRGNLFAPYLHGIHDADGDRIGGTTDNNGGANRNSRVYFTPEEAGTYYVAAGGYSTWKGTYTLLVTDVTDGVPDDYGATTDDAGTLAVGGSVTGNIDDANDRDWLAVELVEGRTYQFVMEGPQTVPGSVYDSTFVPLLHDIRGADGTAIAGTGADEPESRVRYSQVTFTATATDTFYLEASGTPGWSHQRGSYTLSAEDVTDAM